MQKTYSNHEILVSRHGGLAVIALNRPKALNALSLDMIRTISGLLRDWEADDKVKAVFFEGMGERAFCAGGDLRTFHRAGMDFRRGRIPALVPAVFFAEEYSLNRQLFHYKKPTIAFMNGITMGGGYGIAGNCKIRIATEKTVFAMPETGIGFFPDVGSLYHLTRSPHHLGRYLALTGTHIGPQDMVHAGLADRFMPVQQRDNILKTWESLDEPDIDAGAGELQENKSKIEKIFSTTDIHKIFHGLAMDSSAWAAGTVEILRRRSPSSVMVAAHYLEWAQGKSFDDVIRMDFILAQRFLERPDLYEGIRAVIIDKDNQPRWEPSSYEKILQAEILKYFEPTGHDLDSVRIFRT